MAIPLYLRDRFHGVIVCANRPGGFEDVGDELLLALGDHAGSALQHNRLQHELGDAHRSAIRVLAEAVAAHDPVLHRETGELAVHAGLLAKELELDERERDVLVCATLLRAVGYLPLPERPRLRPGELTADERALIELHPRLGFNVLSQAPALHDVAVAVLYHHERVDGTGYPAGLRGEDIPLGARVLAVLEAYGAMTHERPYRTPWTAEQACEALIEGAGTQFDAEIAQLFVEQVRRAPRVARDDVSQAVLDALPLEPGGGEDGMPEGLMAAGVDGATLLGNHSRLQQDVSAASRHARPFGVVVIELVDLPRLNEEAGHIAGDRLIAQAARSARRSAARLGGTAYRISGRRLAILVPAREGQLGARHRRGGAGRVPAGPRHPGGDVGVDAGRAGRGGARARARRAQARGRLKRAAARERAPACAAGAAAGAASGIGSGAGAGGGCSAGGSSAGGASTSAGGGGSDALLEHLVLLVPSLLAHASGGSRRRRRRVWAGGAPAGGAAPGTAGGSTGAAAAPAAREGPAPAAPAARAAGRTPSRRGIAMRGAATSIARSPTRRRDRPGAPMPFPAARASRNARIAAPSRSAARRSAGLAPSARRRAGAAI